MTTEQDRIRHKRWREQNKDKIAAWYRAWREKNGKQRLNYYKMRRDLQTPEERQAFNIYRRKLRETKQQAIADRPIPSICDICHQPDIDGKRLAFDHCHAHGHFRGRLCARCNWILGRVEDSPALLRAMADYLERTTPKPP